MNAGRKVMVNSLRDEKNESWDNAMCPFCERWTTWDRKARQIVSNCQHTAGRMNGMVIFDSGGTSQPFPR